MSKRFVYIMRCHDFFKIGVAKNLRERISALQIGNPYPITLIDSFEIDSCYVDAFEKRIHKSMREWNIRGEWFKLTEGELESVKKLCMAASKFVFQSILCVVVMLTFSACALPPPPAMFQPTETQVPEIGLVAEHYDDYYARHRNDLFLDLTARKLRFEEVK